MAKTSPPKDGSAWPIAAIVLAAGQSTRAGVTNKLLAPIGGVPMVARAVARIQKSGVAPIIVVTGHQEAEVRAALGDAGVIFVHNPDYAAGMAGSIGTGIQALPGDVAGVLICLGDMPAIEAAEIGQLIAAFKAQGQGAICVPVAGGRRGNPVLFARLLFPELQALGGDSGAKSVIGAHSELVEDVAMAGTGTLVDLYTTQEITDFSSSD